MIDTPGASGPNRAADHFDLGRFVRAQDGCYEQALAEISQGRKQSHWMWYIFPQLEGLGFSETSRRYSLKSLAEARAYLAHPLLGPRLRTCAEAALRVEGLSAHDIFGSPDEMKLKSCATLFELVAEEGSVFQRIVDNYFQGERDPRTLRLIAAAHEGRSARAGPPDSPA
jgi:uncharacterized protein (DUF1810 family)